MEPSRDVDDGIREAVAAIAALLGLAEVEAADVERKAKGMEADRRIGRAGQALAPGFGTCLRCETPWKFVEGHETMFTQQHGCFPLCEACWGELGTPEARLPYYERLVDRWQGLCPDEDFARRRQLIRDAVRAGR